VKEWLSRVDKGEIRPDEIVAGIDLDTSVGRVIAREIFCPDFPAHPPTYELKIGLSAVSRWDYIRIVPPTLDADAIKENITSDSGGSTRTASSNLNSCISAAHLHVANQNVSYGVLRDLSVSRLIDKDGNIATMNRRRCGLGRNIDRPDVLDPQIVDVDSLPRRKIAPNPRSENDVILPSDVIRVDQKTLDSYVLEGVVVSRAVEVKEASSRGREGDCR
jgi:hypothetical protein